MPRTFTPSEVAATLQELVEAGVSASDIVSGALVGALSLASAGNLGSTAAASIAAKAVRLVQS